VRCNTGPVKHGRFFHIIWAGTGRRIFRRVPQGFGRSVETIDGLIGLTASIVRSCWDLFACFGWVAFAMWHCGLLE
jgi:hypothetical protein